MFIIKNIRTEALLFVQSINQIVKKTIQNTCRHVRVPVLLHLIYKFSRKVPNLMIFDLLAFTCQSIYEKNLFSC